MILLTIILVSIMTIYPCFYSADELNLHKIEIHEELVATDVNITGKDGFHNDGTIYKTFDLNDDEMKKTIIDIKDNKHWKKGEMPTELKEMLNSDQLKELIAVNDGYYYFKDRHPEATGNIYEYNKVQFNSRYSVNYIVGVLDTEDNKLYYYQRDT